MDSKIEAEEYPQLIRESELQAEKVTCLICMTNEIKVIGKPEAGTFKFRCGHRFCTECSQEHLRFLINNREL